MKMYQLGTSVLAKILE